jgi:Ca2+-transporting ATPase
VNGEKSQDASSKPSTRHGSTGVTLNLADALTPDPGTEQMFNVRDNKFAFSPGQLSKMLNPKSHDAFYAMGGLAGLEKGLRTNRQTGLSVDEASLDGTVSFEEVAPKGTAKHGTAGDEIPVGQDQPDTTAPTANNSTGAFHDRIRVYSANRLPDKKSKTLLQLAWQTYNDKVLILLTIAAVVSLALGLYQTFGGAHENGGARVEWVEGVAILVAIILVVVVGTLNDCKLIPDRGCAPSHMPARSKSDCTLQGICSGSSIS